jgi:DNA-binding MarR family transcriptional regulator
VVNEVHVSEWIGLVVLARIAAVFLSSPAWKTGVSRKERYENEKSLHFCKIYLTQFFSVTRHLNECALMVCAYDVVIRRIQMTTLRRAGGSITPRQLEVLGFLIKREHWSVGEVATILGVSSAAATKSVARLERKGLVSRTVDVMDRRCVNVRLTRAGFEAVRKMTKTV